MKRKIFIPLVLVVFSNLLLLAQSADDVVGLWYSEKDSQGLIPVVEIYKENGKYYGYFFDYKGGYNGPEKKDVKNPNKELRELPLKGLVYLMGLSFDNGEWKGGKIYNPYDGKTYNGKMSLSEDKKTLTVRGSLDKAGVLGKSMKWTKVPDSEKSLYKPLNRSELRKFN
ncbi:DUF2147 domain-containing protein [uncultured Brachyspira sp.]|uniref:DUF2147 domain-containing protein n=1 Tax=uncultured Brachyspira sp. TaxID=221953 RepID=UPI0026330686|nr:DUF2147 domain-containing protein [uncultured Brachyspira sp.]